MRVANGISLGCSLLSPVGTCKLRPNTEGLAGLAGYLIASHELCHHTDNVTHTEGRAGLAGYLIAIHELCHHTDDVTHTEGRAGLAGYLGMMPNRFAFAPGYKGQMDGPWDAWAHYHLMHSPPPTPPPPLPPHHARTHTRTHAHIYVRAHARIPRSLYVALAIIPLDIECSTRTMNSVTALMTSHISVNPNSTHRVIIPLDILMLSLVPTLVLLNG
jgi:hypothetical protein